MKIWSMNQIGALDKSHLKRQAGVAYGKEDNWEVLDGENRYQIGWLID